MVISVTVLFAQFAGGSGTENDPYLVETAEQLDNVRDYLDAHFLQIADIDLSAYAGGSGWQPIGTYSEYSSHPFTGVYDGDEFLITSMNIYSPSHSSLGLFGYIQEAELKNIEIVDASVMADNRVAILAAWSEASEISDVSVSGTISANNYIGGLVAMNDGEIRGSSSDVSISGGYHIGGLVAINEGVIEYSGSAGSINADDYIGGLAGKNEATITTSYSTMNIQGINVVGGLVGRSDGDIFQSFSAGIVQGENMVGGLVGFSNFANISDCFTSGEVSGIDKVSGMIGYNWFGEISNSFAYGEVNASGSPVGGLVGRNQEEQLSEFAHFTQFESSQNDNLLKFWGQDVMTGPVHSNDDIWIQQVGGGPNNSWPTFYEKVTTHGLFRHWPTGIKLEESGAPMEQIFIGGYEQGHYEDLYRPMTDIAQQIRDNGIHLIDDPDTDILYVKIDGENYSSWKAEIVLDEIKEYPVYSWFPMNATQAQAAIDAGVNWFEDADIIAINEIAIYDTIWTEGPSGSLNGQSAWVDSKLWIEGVVEGMQTWGAADTVRIVGDITYANTPPGQAPDDPDDPNITDYFGLISEEKILIAYKHWDAELEIRRDDNTNDIYLYGAYAALAEGDPLVQGDLYYKHDGIFTMEYQHPHGSTPSFWGPSPYTGNDTLYVWPDLHKFVFPEDPSLPANMQGFNMHGANPPAGYSVCGYPYESPEYTNSFPNNDPDNYVFPYGTDYPWYNPVWPESSVEIAFQRGDINLFGSLIQRRRGYVHRSGTDPHNHSYEGVWDLENFIYDGTHPSTGYGKNYHYDSRLKDIELVDFPKASAGEVLYSYWDIETTGQQQSEGGEGRSTEDMTYPYAANTYVGWDFEDIWAADEDYTVNNGYPYLREMTPPVSAEDDTVTQPIAISVTNYPNPFNPETTIEFSIDARDVGEPLSVAIYNIRGQKIRTLISDEEVEESRFTLVWDGRNDNGRIVSSGTYLIKLDTARSSKTHKLMMLK